MFALFLKIKLVDSCHLEGFLSEEIKNLLVHPNQAQNKIIDAQLVCELKELSLFLRQREK